MIIQGVNRNEQKYIFQQKKQTKISFKQVTPEHFFIKMNKFKTDGVWGNFMVDLVDSTKQNILNNDTKLKKVLYKMGAKYNHFWVNRTKQTSKTNPKTAISRIYENLIEKITSSSDFGKKKQFFNRSIVGCSLPNYKFGEYLPLFSQIYKKKEDALLTRKIYRINKPDKTNKKILKVRSFKVFQAQEKVGNKNVVLTQIGYEEPIKRSMKKCHVSLIHPPIKSRKHLLNKAQDVFENLKQYKNAELSEENLEKIYEHVGAIHWCIAQSMPFMRGSAAMADAFSKSLFEALNVQTTPWKKSLSPDLEAFATPLEEFSKKYQTFFEAEK